jgi:hypothetical protein
MKDTSQTMLIKGEQAVRYANARLSSHTERSLAVAPHCLYCFSLHISPKLLQSSASFTFSHRLSAKILRQPASFALRTDSRQKSSITHY